MSVIDMDLHIPIMRPTKTGKIWYVLDLLAFKLITILSDETVPKGQKKSEESVCFVGCAPRN
jgi:hypothetical protein